MLSSLTYYLIVYPISLLPFWVLYRLSDFFYLLLITIFPYRRKVIKQNISLSFPNLSSKELKRIERRFYRHFADIMVEGIKNISISKRELLKRYTVKNPELMDELYKEGKSVLMVSGHYNNWEWLILGMDLLFPHQAVGIGMPLSSGFWDKKLNAKRSRYGMKVIHAKIVHEFFENNQDITATLTLADQSPGDSRKCYWTDFLNQKSGFYFGPEMLANQYDQSVVFFKTRKVKRGYYNLELIEISRTPKQLEYGAITQAYIHELEELIKEEPAFWLWSHKRWKREVPDDLEELHQSHKTKFEERYR